MTNADKLINRLVACFGCLPVPDLSRKYRKFARPDRDDFYFVGRNGALRAGRTQSNSISLTDSIRGGMRCVLDDGVCCLGQTRHCVENEGAVDWAMVKGETK